MHEAALSALQFDQVESTARLAPVRRRHSLKRESGPAIDFWRTSLCRCDVL
jgi:hypothetical protein